MQVKILEVRPACQRKYGSYVPLHGGGRVVGDELSDRIEASICPRHGLELRSVSIPVQHNSPAWLRSLRQARSTPMNVPPTAMSLVQLPNERITCAGNQQWQKPDAD